jgi:hypothetical protein
MWWLVGIGIAVMVVATFVFLYWTDRLENQ